MAVAQKKSGKPTLASFRIDGWAIAWPAGFSWNRSKPEIYPVQIDRLEPHKVDEICKDGKIAWVWFRTADRPSSILPAKDVLVTLLGPTQTIEDTNMPPHRIHPTREAAVERVKKMAADRIADIQACVSAF